MRFTARVAFDFDEYVSPRVITSPFAATRFAPKTASLRTPFARTRRPTTQSSF
jgi:hypothetical protein